MSTSTIHDIGYRHYEGRRSGRAYVLRSLYVHNLRAAFGLGRPARAKIMPFVLAGIMMLPAAGSVAVFTVTDEADAIRASSPATDRTDATDPTDAAGATDPTDRTDATDPTDPTPAGADA